MNWLSVLLLLGVLLSIAICGNTQSIDFEDQPIDEICVICTCKENNTVVDCSRRGLTDVPEANTEWIVKLNISSNEIEDYPEKLKEFTNLIQLDLSSNLLTTLPQDALENLTNLESLDLSRNLFQNWHDLNPNELLVPAEKLKTLDLSHNKLNTLANLEINELLISSSLEILILENCNINLIQGISSIKGLSALRILKLNHNPIRRIQSLISPTLRSLEISHAQLAYIQHNELRYLPSLIHLQLSHNNRLQFSTQTLKSDSLRYLDVSYCNLMHHGLGGFPNIRKVVLSHNMIRYLSSKEFTNNTKLEYLDLANNNIGSITRDTFYDLKLLKFLDLSWNELAIIPEETLLQMPSLTQINLSRNYFTRVGYLKSMSLTVLDMSSCEIVLFGKASLEGLSSLVDLDLSRNLISTLPDSISSGTLRHLNLNYNRIGTINNHTFIMLPRLTTLSVTGNRFTTIWSRSFFSENPYLDRLDLDDNLWRCDCSKEMYDFFEFITLEPNKKEEVYNLRCSSPKTVIDMSWFEACYFTWYPSEQTPNFDSLMWFILFMIIGLSLCFVLVTIIRKSMKRRFRAIQAERERQVEEARERLRQLRIRAEQEAQCNAPDPRDLVSPPSYDEALTMPKLSSSTYSLNETGSGKSRRRRGRRKTKSSGDLLEETERNGDVRMAEEMELVPPNGTLSQRRGRPERYGSHDIAELDQSPGTRRRRISHGDEIEGDDNEEESFTINVEAEVERPLRSRNRRDSFEEAMRESNL